MSYQRFPVRPLALLGITLSLFASQAALAQTKSRGKREAPASGVSIQSGEGDKVFTTNANAPAQSIDEPSAPAAAPTVKKADVFAATPGDTSAPKTGATQSTGKVSGGSRA